MFGMDAECNLSGAAGATFAAAFQFFAASQCLVNEPWPPQASVRNGSQYDMIVVGGGTAGAALAARLSALPVSVLLLEAGGDPPDDSIIPAFKVALQRTAYDWNFTTTNDNFSSQSLLFGSQKQPRGKMLGGSGSINDMIYSRGFPADYDEWAKLMGDDWSWKNVLTYFKKTEHLTDERITMHPELACSHGFDGPIEVSGSNVSTLATDKLLEAFKELGFNIVKDMTNPNEIGAGRFSHTMKGGKRHSTLTAMLNQASERKNLHIIKNAHVSKILVKNNTAYGVQVIIGEDEFHFYGNKEVIITAGTFNTAKLLLLSGIGPKEHLKEFGIEVVKDLPVGKNLHDHTMVLTFMAADNGTCESNEKDAYLDTLMYLYNRSGSLVHSSDLGAYISFNNKTANIPDFAIYPTCMPANSNFYEPCVSNLNLKHYICEKIDFLNRDREIFTLAVVNLKPKSRGKVRLQSLDPLENPTIYSGTFSDTSDLDNYADAMLKAFSVSSTHYFRSKNAFVVDLGVEQCEDLKKREKLKCIAKSTVMSAWHAVGTAAMGTVVDSELRVLGVSGLRVADASVMPKVVRGNTNAPVVMIAEKAADYIKKSLGFISR